MNGNTKSIYFLGAPKEDWGDIHSVGEEEA